MPKQESPQQHGADAGQDERAEAAGHESEAMAEDIAGAQSVQGQLQQFADDLQAANDRALRAQAELENFRKRMRREMEEERRYYAIPLLTELVPVLDNLDLAISSGEKNPAAAEIVQGVKMVQSQMIGVLERNNCRRLGAVGEPFDPNQHQAIAQEATDQYGVGTVTRVTRYGYQLHDRVVRPAEVIVSSGPANPPAP